MSRTGQPILRISGADMLIDAYGLREIGGLGIVLLKPGYPRLAKILSSIADIHLRITREHGAVLVYGVKPRTSLHVLEMDVSKGYAMPKLTPII
ncbi:MAG: hypothetical protein QXN40_08505 [Candidatus Bathyarchaeia archaeon]